MTTNDLRHYLGLNKDQSYGGLIFVVSVLIAIGYLFSLTNANLRFWAVTVPVVLAVLGILGITAWIGWTMLTTPPPAPLETEFPTPTATPSVTSSSQSREGPSETEEKHPK